MKKANKIGITNIPSEKIKGKYGAIGDSEIVQNLRETINSQAEVIAELSNTNNKTQKELKKIGTALNDLKQSIREEGLHVTFSSADLIDIADNNEGWTVGSNGDLRATNDDGDEAMIMRAPDEDDFSNEGC